MYICGRVSSEKNTPLGDFQKLLYVWWHGYLLLKEVCLFFYCSVGQFGDVEQLIFKFVKVILACGKNPKQNRINEK